MSSVEIRIKGQLDQTWSLWLEGLTITPLNEDQTLLSGRLPDQAALFGLINRLRDTGLELVSLQYGDLKYIKPTH